MVTLQTMDTRAAPMAPMMAAALPPPGVGLPPARSSRNFSTEDCVTDIDSARTGSTDHRFGDGVDLLGVEHSVVLLEQPRNAGAMQREFERAETERTEKYLAVLDQAAVALAHAFDARRRRCVGIGEQLQGGTVPPLFLLEQRDAGRARGEYDLRALDGRAALGIARRLDGSHGNAEARLNGIAGGLNDVAFAAGDRHLRAFAGEQHRRALADGTGASEHHGALACERAAVREPRHGGRSRRVRTVAVEHHQDAEIGKEFSAYGAEHRFASGHVAAADEDRRVLLVPEAPGEDGSLDETADVCRVDSAVGANMIGAAVVSDDIIEDRGKGVGVELVEKFFHTRIMSRQVTRCCGLPAAQASILSINWSARNCMAPSEAHAICGVRMKFGRRTSSSGCPFFGGSTVSTSKPAPAINLSSSAWISAASSTSPPRAVLMSRALRFIFRKASMSIRLRVEGSSGQCSEITSECPSTSSCGVNVTPSIFGGG